MATSSLGIVQIADGTQAGTWGDTTNTNWGYIADAVAGYTQVNLAGGTTYPFSTTLAARFAVLNITNAGGNATINFPAYSKVYIVSNNSGYAVTLQVTGGSGGTVVVPNNLNTLVYCDGTNFYSGITGFTGGNLSLTGGITASGSISGSYFTSSSGIPQLGGGAANEIPYQTGINTTNYIPAPSTANTFLEWNGSSFNWVGSTGTASTLTGNTGANQLVYQSSVNTTAFLSNPGAGATYYLTYNNGFNWALGGSVTSINGSTFIAATGGSSPTISLTGYGASGNLLVSNGSNWTSVSPSSAGLASLSGTNTFTGGATFNGNSSSGSGDTVYIGTSTSGGTGIQSVAYNFTQYTSVYTVGGSNLSFNLSSSGANVVFFMTTSQAQMVNSYPLTSATDGGSNLGGPSNRWNTVYATTGTINTSDANEKQQVADLTTAEKAVAQSIKGLFKTFKYNSAVAKKGDGARIHVGVMAQDVKAAFEAQGLDATKYGIFCSDTWEAEDAVLDKDGSVLIPAKTAGTRLGVRYEELLAFVIAAL